MRIENMELPSLKTMTQAGGKLSVELHRRFAQMAADRGINFIVMYGQCEATARMSYLPPSEALNRCGSIGIPIPGGKFTIIDENNNEITAPDVSGELVYCGPNVTLGYAESGEDLIKSDERHGMLLTGDIAKFDRFGYYYIVGRKKRFLKIFGNRVNLDELEQMIKNQYVGIDSAVSGVDDHVYVFITEEKYSKQVKNLLVSKTKLNPVAFKVIVIESIPKNESGKILYSSLLEYCNNDLSPFSGSN
jgi:acyl-coenzyme A synthetase/AMP-(fatty) acid ligase